MGRRIRFPGLIDFTSVDEASELRDLREIPALDRRFEARGPLLNRLLLGRIRSALTFGARRLPPVMPRGDRDRAAAQIALQQRLDALLAAGPPCDEGTLTMLAAAVRGTPDAPPLGELAQQAVGRAFDPDYVGTGTTWAAARDLDAAVRARNPLKLLWLKLRRRVRRAREILSDRAGGDLSAVHGTGIAVHNIVEGLEEMRVLLRDPNAKFLSDQDVLCRCLSAPRLVLRQVAEPAATPSGRFRPGAVVAFRLAAASDDTADPRTVFMTGSWAACPAAGFVPALLLAVWKRAAG